MTESRSDRRAIPACLKTLLLVAATLFSQGALADPPLWESGYSVAATVLNGSTGASEGGGPSGSLGNGAENIALGFNFPYGGNTYSRVIVDSSGTVTLTNSGGDVYLATPTIWKKTDFQSGFNNLGSGSPRPVLMPFNTALSQFNTFGVTYFKLFNDSFNGFTGNRAVITWENSDHEATAFGTPDITFQVQLLADGTIIFGYIAQSSVALWNSMSQGIVVGISNGDGQPLAGSQNLNSGDFGIDLTGYQVWCKDENPSNPVDCVQAGLATNNGFDLHDASIVFNPDGDSGFLVSSTIKDGTGNGGSGLCAVPDEDVTPAPSLWDPDYDISAVELNGTIFPAVAGGPSASLGGGSENASLGFNFPYGGVNYNRVIVSANGAILLTNDSGTPPLVFPTIWNSTNFQSSFTNYGSGSASPVLLPFSSALGQFISGGKVYYKLVNDTFAGHSGDRAIITWVDTSLDGSSTRDLDLQAVLLADGTIIFSYKASNVGSWETRSSQGIVVGVSNGDGAFPLGSQNFSSYDVGADLTVYQIWCRNDNPDNPTDCAEAGLDKNDKFDLDDRSLVFNPDGSTGFLISSSVKDGTGLGGSDMCGGPSAPVAGDDFITATEDKKFTWETKLIDNDSDADGDALKIAKGTFTTAQGGKLTIESTSGKFTYKPPEDFSGSDSVDYTLQEKKSGGMSDTGTLFITVDPVNDAPKAVTDNIETAPNTVFNSVQDLDANDTDADGPSLSVVAGTFDTKKGGSITIAGNGSYSYTPPANYAGDDQVKYTVTDGSLEDTGKLRITVTTANIDALEDILKSVKKLLKNKKVKKHGKSKKAVKKAKKHIEKAIDFLAMGDSVSADSEVDEAIADLGKVKKKKSDANDLITELDNLAL